MPTPPRRRRSTLDKSTSGDGSGAFSNDQESSRRVALAIVLGWETGALIEAPSLEQNRPHGPLVVGDSLVATFLDDPRSRLSVINDALHGLELVEEGGRLERTLASLRATLGDSRVGPEDLRRPAFALHVQLVEILSVARLAKAYGVGQALAGLARTGRSKDDLVAMFSVGSLNDLQSWLVDLKHRLAPGSVEVVTTGLSRWRRHLESEGTDDAFGRYRQMDRYRALLCGELGVESLLSSSDYEQVALVFARRVRRVVTKVIARASLATAPLVAGVIVAILLLQGDLTLDEPEKLASDLSIAAAALGLVVLLMAVVVRRTLGRAEEALWGASIIERAGVCATELDEVGSAPTRRDRRWRRRRAAFVGASPGIEDGSFLGFFAPEQAAAETVTPFDDGGEQTSFWPPGVEAPTRGPSLLAVPETGKLASLEKPDEDRTTAPRRRRRALSLVAAVVIVVGIGALLRGFVVSSYYVPTGSMSPTLQVGDRILVDKLGSVKDSINRGDIIVFDRPTTDHVVGSSPVLVKRVIALPGDRVSSVDDTIYVNGRRLSEPWLPALTAGCAEAAYNVPDVVVPAGSYFVLGDCRANSDDSRTWGTVPVSDVIGKVFLVYWRDSHPWFHWF